MESTFRCRLLVLEAGNNGVQNAAAGCSNARKAIILHPRDELVPSSVFVNRSKEIVRKAQRQ